MAEKAKVNTRTIRRAKQVQRIAPKRTQEVIEGKVSLNQVLDEEKASHRDLVAGWQAVSLFRLKDDYQKLCHTHNRTLTRAKINAASPDWSGSTLNGAIPPPRFPRKILGCRCRGDRTRSFSWAGTAGSAEKPKVTRFPYKKDKGAA